MKRSLFVVTLVLGLNASAEVKNSAVCDDYLLAFMNNAISFGRAENALEIEENYAVRTKNFTSKEDIKSQMLASFNKMDQFAALVKENCAQ